MGYRSDVGIALTGKGVKTMKAMLDNEPPDIRDSVKNFLRYAESHSRDSSTGAQLWIWESVKWYDFDRQCYPDVDFFRRLMQALEDQEFYFVRIGEDYDDNACRGEFWDNPFELGILRSVYFQTAN